MGVLFGLTSDKVPFRWDFTQQRAFEEIKRLRLTWSPMRARLESPVW